MSALGACGAAGPAPADEPVAKRRAHAETGPRDVLAMSPSEIQARLREDPAALGSVSLGRPNGGALFGALRMPDGDGWEVVDPENAWATQETIDYLVTAISEVEGRFPSGDALFVGQLSRRDGGRLWPHASHQSGRDADVGYYYLPGTRGGWYQEAASNNLDRARTWALLRALIMRTDVEHIFISRSVQRLLKEHALDRGEDPEWVDSIFDYRSKHSEPLVRDAMGHATHMHVRFFNPRAQHLGENAHHILSRQTRHQRRILPPRAKPLAARRLPPRKRGVTATN